MSAGSTTGQIMHDTVAHTVLDTIDGALGNHVGMTLLFEFAGKQYEVAMGEARFIFTTLRPKIHGESWDSGLWLPRPFLQGINKRFRIRWVQVPDWELPVIQLTLHDSAMLMYVLSTIPGDHRLNYIAHRSDYWLFHDLTHARLDIRRGVDPITGQEWDFYIANYTEINEDKVLEESARLAERHGIDPVEIRAEIARAKDRRNRHLID